MWNWRKGIRESGNQEIRKWRTQEQGIREISNPALLHHTYDAMHFGID